jgi:hypothetical protein
VEDAAVLHIWSARRLRPIVLVYVALVFVAFIALAFFGFHSMTGVKALAIAALGYFVGFAPGVLTRIEYRLTESGLAQRPVHRKSPAPFKDVFRWEELSHVVPMGHGFKFYRPLAGTGATRRFWQAHVSDAFSGEVHLEAADRERVLRIVAERGIPLSKPASTS